MSQLAWGVAYAASSTTGLSYETLMTKVPAVHATYRFPADGFVRAGKEGEIDTARKVSIAANMTLPMTVHFALGGLVPGHESGSWDDCPFAVVTSLGSLAPRLVNVFAQDTAYFGDVPLGKDAVVVVSEKERHQVRGTPPFKVVFFDPDTTSLREAVNGVLRDKGYLRYAMEYDTGYSGDLAFHGQANLADPAYWRALLARYPHLKVMAPIHHVLHSLDNELYHFGQSCLPAHSRSSCDARYLRAMLAVIDRNLADCTSAIAKFPDARGARAYFDKTIRSLDPWRRRIGTEIILQEQKHLAVTHREQPEVFSRLVEALLSKPGPCPQGSGGEEASQRRTAISYRSIVYPLGHLTVKEFDVLLQSLDCDLWPAETMAEIKIQFAMHRLVRSDIGEQEVRAAIAYLQSVVQPLSTEHVDALAKELLRFPLSYYFKVYRNPVLVRRLAQALQAAPKLEKAVLSKLRTPGRGLMKDLNEHLATVYAQQAIKRAAGSLWDGKEREIDDAKISLVRASQAAGAGGASFSATMRKAVIAWQERAEQAEQYWPAIAKVYGFTRTPDGYNERLAVSRETRAELSTLLQFGSVGFRIATGEGAVTFLDAPHGTVVVNLPDGERKTMDAESAAHFVTKVLAQVSPLFREQ